MARKLSKRVIFVQLRSMLSNSLPDGQNQYILWCIIVAWEQRNSWSLFMPLLFCGHLLYIPCSGCVLLTLHGDNRGVWRGVGGEGSGRRSAGSPFSVRCGPWAPTHRAKQISKLSGSWVQEGGKEEHGKECTEMEGWPKQRGHSDEQTSSWTALRRAGRPAKKVEIYRMQTAGFLYCEVVALQDKVWLKDSGGNIKFMHWNVQKKTMLRHRGVLCCYSTFIHRKESLYYSKHTWRGRNREEDGTGAEILQSISLLFRIAWGFFWTI